MLKKAVIVACMVAILVTCLLCPLAVNADTFTQSSSDLFAPLVWSGKYLNASGTYVGGTGYATYCSTNAYGGFQFGNIWKTSADEHPAGNLKASQTIFRINASGANPGDKVFLACSVWIKYVGGLNRAFIRGCNSSGSTLWSDEVELTYTSMSGFEDAGGACFKIDYTGTVTTEERVEYFVLGFQNRDMNYTGTSDLSYNFSWETMFATGAALDFAALEQQRETNKKLDEIKTEQAETNEKLDDLLEQPEKEKQEADSTGNSAADGVMDAIPGDTAGFSQGIQKFAAALSYSGTECEWTLPAITLPAIPGVMPKMQLTGDLPINFGEWVQKIPGNVLEIVQLVLTVALVVYCFKELYSTISYFLTLKGGGKE